MVITGTRATLRPGIEWGRNRWRLRPRARPRNARIHIYPNPAGALPSLRSFVILSTQVLAWVITMQLGELEKGSFSHLLDALKYGAPPHGGIALGNRFPFLFLEYLIEAPSGLGFDRLMTILCGAESIRDVIAFPKTSAGTDLVFKSPVPVDKKVLYQYGIQPRT